MEDISFNILLKIIYTNKSKHVISELID